MFKQLAQETVIFGIARFVTAAISLFTIPFYTRIFSLSDYGTISILVTLQAILSILFGLSLESAYTRFYHDSNFSPNLLLGVLLKFQLIYGTAILVALSLAGYLVLAYWLSIDLFESVLLVLLVTFFGQFVKVFMTAARMRHAIYEFTWISISSTLLCSISSMLIVYHYPSVKCFFLGQLIGNIIALLLSLRLLDFRLADISTISLKKIRPLLRFSLPLIPAAIATYLNSSLDKWTLSIYSIDNVATYSLAVTISSIIAILISILTSAFLPTSMKIIQLENKVANIKLNILLRCFSVLICSAAIIVQFISPFLIGSYVPFEYSASTKIVGILSFSSIWFGYTYFSVLGSWKMGHSRDYSYSVLLGVCINAILNFLLIPRFDIIGASVATSIGMLVICLSSFYLSATRFSYGYSYGKLLVTNMISFSIVLYLSVFQSSFKSMSALVISIFFTIIFLVVINLPYKSFKAL